jgi:hypothetical protein
VGGVAALSFVVQALAEALLAQTAHELGHAQLTLMREAVDLLQRAEGSEAIRHRLMRR